MGRIGLALALLIGWTSVAHAIMKKCPTVRLELARGDIETRGTRPMPQITTLELYSDVQDGSETIRMAGTFDPETTSLRLTTSGGYSLTTTPDELWVCSNTLVLRPHEHITIVAYDKAGNASVPFESDVTVTRIEPELAHERHHKCGLGEAILLLGSMVMSGGLFIALVIIGMIRKRVPSSVVGELVAPIHAENVARIVARGYAIKLAVALLTTTGLWTFDHPYLAILVSPFVAVWALELLVSRLVVGQFDKPVQRLEKRENWIYINSRKLYAPRRAWAKASALPTAAVLD
jgi:hypothetical protein